MGGRKKTQNWVDLLSRWFVRIQRPLPWRQTRDPYAIWISEVMLQQTQVATVLPYYARFLDRFPDVFALAAAPEPEVLHAWSGLGYYSRARNLRKGAQYLVEKHSGTFPRDREGLLAIPGIGPYTAGAIASIAFDQPEPIVDGNVQRVFGRFFAVDAQLGSRAASDFFWEKARDWVQHAQSPRIFNQSLMELGATVCTKGQPACRSCPVNAGCEARARDAVAQYPKPKPRRKMEKLWWAALIHERGNAFWLTQNAEGDWWSGLWDFPRREGLAEGELPTQGRPLSRVEHTVTHHRISVAPFVLGWKSKRAPGAHGRWVTEEQARRLPLSSLAKKVLGAYGEEKR